MATILEAALRYAAAGMAVIPLQPRGKKPLSRHGSKDASKEVDQIEKWWKEEPEANLGIVTGKISGVIGVDVDVKDGRPGKESLAKLFEGVPFDNTMTVVTPTGGMHLYFKIPEGVNITNRADLLPGIDIRGEGGYLVAPPSVIGDDCYRWVPDRQMQILPEPIAKQLHERKKLDNTKKGKIGKGQRNQQLASIAGALRRQGASRETILGMVTWENEQRCDPPLNKSEVEQIVDSIMRYDASTHDHLTFSDLGNSERFIRESGADLRYVAEYEKWIAWNGSRWKIDVGDIVMTRATKTIRAMLQDALQENDAEKRKAMIGWARKSAGSGSIDSMLKLARKNPSILIKQELLDNDPMLFAAKNGVIDLSTGHLCESRREDMVTCGTDVEFVPHAQCPQFQNFLDRIFDNNAPVIEFVQRAIGYSLTGKANEQCLFFAYGRGANGKSTLFNTVNTLLGDYSRSISAEMLMDRPAGGATNDLARLRGARFITTVEVEEGKRMAEALVKQVTGGEKISARFLYGEFFEYLPSFKLWLAANHHPVIRGTDMGIWRRIRLIPFTVSIPEKDRDKDLSQKLLQELPGILNWAIDGCLSWQKQGLNPPPEVLAVTDAYRNEMDVFGSWMKECCTTGPDLHGSAVDMYNNFRKWAQDNGEWMMPQSKFKTKIVERGFERMRKGNGFVYKGIGLLATEYTGYEKEIG